MSDCCTTETIEILPEPKVPGKLRTVALIGPPNSGKSTLFNRLTGLRQKVANYPGVTVEQHVGKLSGIGRSDLYLIDLPGIYSLDSYSEDARVSVEVLTGRMPGTPQPDAILLVLDSLHLSRQLMLAAPILALKLPTMVLLNMSDLMEARGGEVDTLALAREIGVPVAKISAARGTGIDAITHFLNRKSEPAIPSPGAGGRLELPVVDNPRSYRQWATGISTRTKYKAPLSSEWTRKLDRVLLHRILGPILFLVVVIAVFQVVFSIGQPLSDGFGDILNNAGDAIGAHLGHGWLESLLIDGVWKGVASVLVFLPQILLLFLFIGVLEDSGYLARAALIADRMMRSIGLNGKAFIPLLSAYACAVPAIMATRTIENKRDRFATILVTPFMTCSARLPIYLLMIAAFIPNKPLLGDFFGMRAAVMLSLYLLGFLAALGTARLLKSSILKTSTAPFILELPQYRLPTLRSLGLRVFDRGKVFLKQAGTIILTVTLILWVLSHLPMHSDLPDSIIGRVGHLIEPIIRPLGFNWKIGIGLLSSVVAREVIVGTLGTLYGAEGAALQTALHHDLTLGGALALVVFFAFAMQCTSTLAIVKRETNSWKWPALQFAYMSALAYLAALATNQIVSHLVR
ncbi:ferrous iron transport protein B [Silvibacterium dinghuense]|uniref:Ferrous iron transport protein B n=1 Tax=Silvibacterium dinghuense TaxID=1560006 RepID=A0A4Q1SHG8_9BACT|nr:ferrous iron transport protein B [Silvibacterium dinghuense]RXS96620.1 ferrous iron transport protein B [Silvibacterium dinghuense]GGG92303.1 ferrous iron transporter B [Silvibacterium dinghuense]